MYFSNFAQESELFRSFYIPCENTQSGRALAGDCLRDTAKMRRAEIRESAGYSGALDERICQKCSTLNILILCELVASLLLNSLQIEWSFLSDFERPGAPSIPRLLRNGWDATNLNSAQLCVRARLQPCRKCSKTMAGFSP